MVHSLGMASPMNRVFCVRVAVMAFVMSSRVYAVDFSPLFKADSKPPCEPTEFSPPVYKACKGPSCGQEQVGEQPIGTDTNWSTDWCGFLAQGWDAGWCRSNRDPRTTRATSCCKSERYVDLLKRQCAIQVVCYVPIMDSKTCRTQDCGVETQGQPIKWKQCKSFDFGLDDDRFAETWNTAGPDTRAALTIILLMHENRALLEQALVSRILQWLSTIDLSAERSRSQLSQVKKRLSLDSAKFVLRDFEAIIGS